MSDRMTATPSQEWTEATIASIVNEAKRIMTEAWRAGKCGASEVANAQDALDQMYHGFNRANDEVARLRAENERLTAANESHGRTVAFTSALNRALRSQLAATREPCPKCAEREARMFPIMDGPDVPWSLLAPHEKHAMKNHSQTLERLAERGGLAAVEALQILDGLPFGSVKLTSDYANRMLAERVRSTTSRSRVSDNG